MKETYAQYALNTLEALINLPSPSGYTDAAAAVHAIDSKKEGSV